MYQNSFLLVLESDHRFQLPIVLLRRILFTLADYASNLLSINQQMAPPPKNAFEKFETLFVIPTYFLLCLPLETFILIKMKRNKNKEKKCTYIF